MPFGEPAALIRLELRTGSEAVQAAFSRGKAAPPWQGTRQSHGWALRGEQLFPKGAGVVDAMGIPNRMWHTWRESPTPGHLCAALIHHGDPEHHLRSATSGPFRNANGWETGLFPQRFVAVSPILRIPPSSLQASTPVPQCPGDRKPARRTDAQGSAVRQPLPPRGLVPAGLGGTHS